MRTTRTTAALALSALLVLTVLAPAALAASAQANDEIDVETHEATNVTNESAELRGEVTGLDNESATVYFTYWVEGDGENVTETANETTDADAEYKKELSGLENDTTYVYVAHADANGTTYSGEEGAFTTGEANETGENETDDEATDAFGQQVSAFVHGLLEERGDDRRGIGQAVSEFVTSNNPGADKRPDHAGPPEDRGKSASDDDKRQGPPADKGPDADDRGNGDDADDEDENDEDENEDSDEDDEEETETPTETATET